MEENTDEKTDKKMDEKMDEKTAEPTEEKTAEPVAEAKTEEVVASAEEKTEEVVASSEEVVASSEEKAEKADDTAEEEAEEAEESMDENFEEMLMQSEERAVHEVHPGQKLAGRIVAVSKGIAFVDIGMRSEASMPLIEDDERYEALAEGQEMPVFVTAADSQIQVALDPAMGHGDIDRLADAQDTGEPVEGKVSSLMSGGYEVNMAGVRCFCPHTQIDLRSPANPEEMVNKVFPFRILEVDIRKKNVVVSRRALLEEERQAALAEIRGKLVVDAVLTGQVADIQSFGAFVDFGGIQGLLHISQLAYHNVHQVEDILSVGDDVEVKILEIKQDARGKDRISLSRKALLPNPWDNLPFKQGGTIEGVVARKSNFGIFITLIDGIDGLLPKRMMKKAGRSVEMDGFERGQTITVDVVEINREDRKIALALPGWDDEIRSELKPGETLKAEVIKVLPNGILVQALEDPARGLIHKRSLKQQSAKQIYQDFPVGKEVEVVLNEVDDLKRLNFVLKSDAEDVLDPETLSKFSDTGSGLGHNPFASFFNKK